MQTEILEV